MEFKKIKSSFSLKLFVIGFLIAVLMIPTGMIAVLINERESRQNEAFNEVSKKWGAEQVITGPVLTVPYKIRLETNVSGERQIDEVIRYAHFLPEVLRIDGKIDPELRKRGIYEIAVYTSSMNLNGEFMFPDFSKWDIKDEDIMYDKAFVAVGISDMKGLKENVILKWNDEEKNLSPGIETNDVLASGMSTFAGVDKEKKSEKYFFDFNVVLNGSRDVLFSPIGKTTELKLASSWLDPSFQGAFLPEDYSLTENGFEANWKILELNRNFPQSFLGGVNVSQNINTQFERYEKTYTAISVGSFRESDFGVRLIVQADEYQKTVRALKYAIMLISLTFLVLFFFEALNKVQVHPMQYILIGLALSCFYILLLSIAEHLGFDLAYLISVLATVGLISFYSKSVLGKWRDVMLESLIIVFVYSFIYVILQLKDYSLLVGSVGLFVILAIIMYVSGKIDWYGTKKEKED